jgi:hypothetical protein
MRFWTPPRDGTNELSWWRPLSTLCELLALVPDAPTIVPCDFRLIGRVDRPGRAGIWRYRHKATGRFLDVDDALVVHRERVTGRFARDRGGWYSALRRLELEVAPAPDGAGYCAYCRALLARRARSRDHPAGTDQPGDVRGADRGAPRDRTARRTPAAVAGAALVTRAIAGGYAPMVRADRISRAPTRFPVYEAR